MRELEIIEGEELEKRIVIAAYHEAGHAVVAAGVGLPLRAEGITVGQDAQGLACYYKQPDDTDLSVEANVLASFAGCYAENYFRRQQGYRERNHEEITWSLD
jgi:hypothetical protein